MGAVGRLPGLLRSKGRQGARQAAKQISLGTGGGEGKAHAADHLDDTGCDFQQAYTQGRELHCRQVAGLWNRVSDGEHDHPLIDEGP